MVKLLKNQENLKLFMSVKKCVILFSGQGSNMENLIKKKAIIQSKISYVAAFTDNSEANGISICKAHNISVHISDNENVNLDLTNFLRLYNPDLVILAGYMKIVPENIVNDFKGKIINIHPSLLPKYPGLNTYEKVLKNKDKYHGVTVHFINSILDNGPIILQGKVSIANNLTQAELKSITHKIEYKIYPIVIQWIANDIVTLNNNKVVFKNKILESPITHLIENEDL